MKDLLELFFYNVKCAVQDIGPEYNLADGQIFLLHILWKSGTCKATYLADQIGITSGAVTGMMDKLAGMGLITRERSEKDRRVVMVSLTDEGLKTVQAVQEARFERLKGQLRELSGTELMQAVASFQKMNAVLKPAVVVRGSGGAEVNGDREVNSENEP
ncbi:transcriptional regulator, marr family [Heliomicrobium modesticaldum Ice1]|uniref:Transcriptional regulator, marr family n=1 Tax=Heliobacterium modesticaldum (strain ATCC 51547 / Ice1) TaxID=498761 RepID=B0TDA7_HELMI|nr:MarR family transcriptional regulator [Heliomicrobium modesticaldum]ABZ84148.1 transcriptional regulator, marr family [Heliomicrobium modesticaldum Ice1]